MTELEEDILLDDELELEEELPEEHEHWRIEVDKGQSSVRVDKFLMDHMPGTSRNRIQKAAEAGSIRHHHACPRPSEARLGNRS